MTMKTAGSSLEIAVHAVVEPGVDFPDNLYGIGVFALSILLRLIRVASGAELCEVRGVGPADAERIIAFFAVERNGGVS